MWGAQVTTSNYRGATGLSSWTASLLCLHGITRFCHSETWLFISLLCWWNSTLPLIQSWWSDDSCSHLSMSSRHFLLDEGPSPSTETCQNRTLIRHINHNCFKSARNQELRLMISWLSQTKLLTLPDPADLFYSTSRRSGPFFRNMLHNS